LPGSGKRELAAGVARAEVDLADASVERLRRDLATRVKSLYAELHRVEKTRAVLAESAALLDRLIESTRARYEAGDGILESVLKAQTERTRLETDVATLEQQRQEAEIELAALLGRADPGSFGVASAPLIGLGAARDELEAAALDDSPVLAVLRATERRDERKTELSRRQQGSDYMWGASYGYRGDFDPMVEGMFGVRLPIFRASKQAAATAQAEHEQAASQRDVESAERRVRSEVRLAVARVDRADRLLRLYTEGLVPQARSALDAATAAYTAGRADFATLIDDLLQVVRYQIELEAERTARIQALVELERVTGKELVLPGDPAAGGGGAR